MQLHIMQHTLLFLQAQSPWFAEFILSDIPQSPTTVSERPHEKLDKRARGHGKYLYSVINKQT